MVEFSLITIVKGRRKQLANMLDAVASATIVPRDIQIVCMDNGENIPIIAGLNISIQLTSNDVSLPLAAARNLGIRASQTDLVIFIDVDCIVSPMLFANILSCLSDNLIAAAYPLYLPLLPETGNYSELLPIAVPHPARNILPAGEEVEHLYFWSLIFAIHKQTFEKIGGFDESFTGYGAEDTDFAMQFHAEGVKLIFVNDYVLHQYHIKHDPPLDHFNSIVSNAIRYKQKWGSLPMRRWLNGFEELGLIEIDTAGNIVICQNPTTEQLNNSVSIHPY